MRTIVGGLRRRFDAAREEDSGIVAIWTALLLVVLMGMAAIAVDIARWYVEVERVQKTVDAAALAGSVYMPNDLPQATATADELIIANGWDLADVGVTTEQGDRASQLRVTMSSEVTNHFGAVLGLPTSTITRTAVAEFSGPAPLGSPSTVHGNEPWVSGSNQGSALPSPLPSNLTNNPQFWSTIVGPEVHKTQGDRFSTRRCGGGESGCVGSTNDEFDPKGYAITIRVLEDLSGPLTVQLYDAAYVDTDSRCTSLPSISSNRLGSNTYVDDARERYRNNPNPISSAKPSYCTGDNDNGSRRFGSETATVTSFGLLRPTELYDPFSPSANEPSDRICAEQYPGFRKTGRGNNQWVSTQPGAAPGGNATQQLSRNSELTELFHRWTNFCTIPGPVPAGDYYLRVRTNIAEGNPQAVFTQQGDNPSVKSNGSNRFAVRAVPSNSADRTKVAVSPYLRMPIFANSNGSQATFNLIRVLPGGVGQSIDFSFFDVGDAAGNGTLSVLPPGDSNVAAATDCTKFGKENGPDADCRITNIRRDNGWDGKTQQMLIPVPADYTCDYSNPYGCWWRLKVDFGGGVDVTDQTTWTAQILGDPVRLVE